MPGEQPRIANLVKLNTNESPFGPSPLALEAMRAAAVDTLRLYPDPEAQELREELAVHHGIKPRAGLPEARSWQGSQILDTPGRSSAHAPQRD